MRILIKEKPVKTCSIGDTRIITKFLIFPCRIKNEIRWLEKVSISQRCTRGGYAHDCTEFLYWKNVSFIK